MNLEFFSEIAEHLDELKIVGVSELEIKRVESRLRVTLPKAYKEFLMLAGLEAGLLSELGETKLSIVGSTLFQKGAARYLEKEMFVSFEKPYWIFGFAGSGGIFFYLEENLEDPFLYGVEGETQTIVYSGYRLSDYVMVEMYKALGLYDAGE